MLLKWRRKHQINRGAWPAIIGETGGVFWETFDQMYMKEIKKIVFALMRALI